MLTRVASGSIFGVVVLTLAIVLALLVPWPWSLIVVGLGIVGEIGEVVWGRRIAKRWRPRTGAEAMVGMQAEVVSSCRPRGQVRVHGELWEATCAEGADVGETVRVKLVDGLMLVVQPVESSLGQATGN
jgi:membrane protein implicated in regulation of membrane protease activity